MLMLIKKQNLRLLWQAKVNWAFKHIFKNILTVIKLDFKSSVYVCSKLKACHTLILLLIIKVGKMIFKFLCTLKFLLICKLTFFITNFLTREKRGSKKSNFWRNVTYASSNQAHHFKFRDSFSKISKCWEIL